MNPDTNVIRELLEETTESHLADCLDLIPVPYMEALNRFIADQRRLNVFKAIYRFQVIQDVAALVAGNYHDVVFSKPFLNSL